MNGSWITLLVIEIHLKIKCAPDPTLVSPDSLRGDKEKLKRHLHVAHLPHPHLELFQSLLYALQCTFAYKYNNVQSEGYHHLVRVLNS